MSVQEIELAIQKLSEDEVAELVRWLKEYRNKGREQELEAAYAEMAADREREAEAHEWIEGLIGDVANEARLGLVG